MSVEVKCEVFPHSYFANVMVLHSILKTAFSAANVVSKINALFFLWCPWLFHRFCKPSQAFVTVFNFEVEQQNQVFAREFLHEQPANQYSRPLKTFHNRFHFMKMLCVM